ncbi:MAG: cytochrome c oxidase subunit 3, partial [Armatimonadota bacterium]|nr:cytochrome c oxidase subunit 3 [Armatimonadota bacterium]
GEHPVRPGVVMWVPPYERHQIRNTGTAPLKFICLRRAEADWRAGPFPPAFWATTGVLLASSAAVERARARGRAGDLDGLRRGLWVATALGGAFLGGQVVAWGGLLAAGVGLATSAHASFLYLLTGAHALHVAGGVGALAYAGWRAHRALVAPSAMEAATPAAIYWHVVDGLWLYVLAVLFIL